MALVKTGQVKRVEIPHEPGEWMEFRRLAAKTLAASPDLAIDSLGDQDDATRYRRALAWAQATVVAWSYPEPLATETLEQLDMRTLVWVLLTAARYSWGGETAEEKKADSPPSIGSSMETPAPPVPTSGS